MIVTSSEKKEKKLYNENRKLDFLSIYNDDTKETYIRVLESAYDFEEEFEKDLCEFNVAEISLLIQDLNPSTTSVSRHYAGVISTYIGFCLDKGYKRKRIVNSNPVKGVGLSFFDRVVEDAYKRYMTDKQVMQIEDACNNYQDAVIFRLIYEGVQGDGCAELLNLKKGDIDSENNVLKLINSDGSIRELKVSPRCIDMVVKASKQEMYLLRNGEVDAESRRQEAELLENEYVIRNSKTHVDKDRYHGSVDKYTIYRRFDMIRDVLGVPHMTVKSISRSGMIKWGKLYLEKHGEIRKEDYEEIAERYKFGSMSAMKEFVNEKMIAALYGE